MENARKKDLIREYKEQKQQPGIFAVRCGEQVWVGSSKNLDKQQNSIWFQLRMNGHMNKTMQAAWNAHGADAFTFEVLETFADEDAGMVVLRLKERDAYWREHIGAARAL